VVKVDKEIKSSLHTIRGPRHPVGTLHLCQWSRKRHKLQVSTEDDLWSIWI